MESGYRLFGTDGVRGHANRDLTIDLAIDLARAAGEGTDGPVVIGRDTRRSSPMLAAALHAGFNSVGVDTVDLGTIPVGAVSRLTIDIGAQYGIMVSASHNPADDNGIKFFSRDGAKLSDEREAAVETRFRRGAPWRSPTGPLIGMQSAMPNALDRYLDHLKADASYSLRGMEFVLDCANGAAFAAAPELFRRLGASVEVHGAEPDGTNINEGCGATHAEFLGGKVAGRVGFAFDGDADRCMAVDEDGVTVNGDVIMAILANHLKERGKLKRDVVVATVMSNLGFHRAMEALGIEVRQTTVGDRHVLAEMRRIRAVLGGEQSGHILLEDRTTGDGLRTAVRLAEVLAATARPLRELRQIMTEFPQVLENIRVADRGGLEDCTAVWDAVRAAEERLGSEGRVLVRASGTEPLVRVMVEALTREIADEVAGAVKAVVVSELG
jgi:phosphoglucosamine mutase